MAQFSDLINLVEPEVIGCPRPLIEQAIRDKAIEWCRRTRCWATQIGPLPVAANSRSVMLDADTGTLIEGVKHARWHEDNGGGDIRPATSFELDAYFAGWRTSTGGGPRNFYILEMDPDGDGLTMVLSGTSAEATTPGVMVDVVLKPTAITTRCPKMIIDEYGAYIADGAKARLMLMKKPWGDASIGSIYEATYRQQLRRERVRVAKQYTNAVTVAMSDRSDWYEV